MVLRQLPQLQGTSALRPALFHLTNGHAMTLHTVRGLLDHVPNTPFFVKDKDLRYVCANTSMLELCGVERSSDLIGKSARDFFPEPVADSYERWDRQVMSTRQPQRDRIHLAVRKAGAPVWLLFGRWPIAHDDGRIRGVVAIARILQAPDRRGGKYERIAAAIDQIQMRYDKALDIHDLAQSAGVSVCQLERDFLELLGVSPRRYLQRIRLEAALVKLMDDASSVLDVALACGYTDQSAFTRSFRSAVGMTPSDYRRSSGRLIA